MSTTDAARLRAARLSLPPARSRTRRNRSAEAAAALLALLTVSVLAAGNTGCSLGIDIAPEDAPPTAPAPLQIVGPREGLVYNAADDEDPLVPGIQLTVRVDVDDAALDQPIARVALALPDDGVALDDVVAADLAGRRAAFFDVTLGRAAHLVVATALGDAEARAVLLADDVAEGAPAAPAE